MAQAFLLGRILVGCYYLQAAYHHFTAVGQLSRAAAAHGVPAPEVAVIGGGVLLLVAGLVVPARASFRGWASAAIVLFLVPVTLIMHPFWADRNATQRQSRPDQLHQEHRPARFVADVPGRAAALALQPRAAAAPACSRPRSDLR